MSAINYPELIARIKQDFVHSSDDQEADISDSLNCQSSDEETDSDNHGNVKRCAVSPRYAMYCDLPQFSHHRGSCSFQVYRLLSDIRRKREQSCTVRGNAFLRRLIDTKYMPFYLAQQRYDVAGILQYEKLSIIDKPPSKMEQAKVKPHFNLSAELEKFRPMLKYPCHKRILEIATTSHSMKRAGEKRDIENCLSAMLQLAGQVQFSGDALERNLLYYNAGTFFMFLLQYCTKKNWKQLIGQVPNMDRQYDIEDMDFEGCLKVKMKNFFPFFINNLYM